jgi:hypothetical protein
MACQLRPLVYSLGIKKTPRSCLTPRKSRVKNLWRNKQGNCQCKMAGAGIRSFAKFRGQMPRIATTGITSWQTALKWTVDSCGMPSSALRLPQSSQACGNPLSNSYFYLWQSARGYSILGHPRSKRRGLPQSAAHIWARNLARDWIPAPAILHQESHCLKRLIFLPRNFQSIKYIRGGLYRTKLSLSWYMFLVTLYL